MWHSKWPLVSTTGQHHWSTHDHLSLNLQFLRSVSIGSTGVAVMKSFRDYGHMESSNEALLRSFCIRDFHSEVSSFQSKDSPETLCSGFGGTARRLLALVLGTPLPTSLIFRDCSVNQLIQSINELIIINLLLVITRVGTDVIFYMTWHDLTCQVILKFRKWH